jgi:glycosyltransferase involved in cell wall biosynthesis
LEFAYREPEDKDPRSRSCGPREGVDLWLEAVCELSRGGNIVSATWIGGGDRDWGERQARRRGLSETVRFLPPRESIAGAFATADVLLVSSRWESFGLVGLEALATGLPVVAFEVGGLRESLGHLASFAPPGDSSAMAQLVLDAVQADRHQLRKEGRERAALFSPAVYGERLLAILRTELQQGG